ncbi:MAG: nitrite/sulfite reductase [Pseudomonadota bacterium]
MYRYDEFDRGFVKARVDQFREQVERRVSGELSEDNFKPIRLQNGVYLQLHAYMLRIAVPYGTLNSTQMRMLAHIARKYDRGYGHLTTRQNIQFNWPKLSDIPDILEDLASVEMHAIQTSGNCIRNVTADHFAGAAADEVADPRHYAEILRQWSTVHPEFLYLPRKFKIAVIASPNDRAAMQFHDIGLEVRKNDAGELGLRVFVGGGLGRTPMVAKEIRSFLQEADLLSYCEAILRVYNLSGRRDNKYKARIKILVHETGLEDFKAQVEAEFQRIKDGVLQLPRESVEAIEAYFAPPAFETLPAVSETLSDAVSKNAAFNRWTRQNVHPHRKDGYASLTIALKGTGEAPGDVTAEQMEVIADLAQRYSFDELRFSHEQNAILPHVKQDDLPAIYDVLVEHGLAAPNAGLITDIIACPGLDYCALATARSIPVAQSISERFADMDRQEDIGALKVKISGCINACGHHHAGHIGILGLDKRGEETYQVTLGGSGDEQAAVGEIVGRGFAADEITDAVETIVNIYLEQRVSAEETFLETYRRVGAAPFKEGLYPVQEAA